MAAYKVPWFEIAAGLCLMLGILTRGAILTIAGLVVVFAVCIGWAWTHQLDISCGCHGGDAPIHYSGKVAEFAGYFMFLGWFWWVEGRKDPRNSGFPAWRFLHGGLKTVHERNLRSIILRRRICT